MINLDSIDGRCNACEDFRSSLDAYFDIDEIKELSRRLRQAEKDAARYRWIKENSQFGVGRCGVDWELYFEGPAPDNSAMIELHIDEAMQCK